MTEFSIINRIFYQQRAIEIDIEKNASHHEYSVNNNK